MAQNNPTAPPPGNLPTQGDNSANAGMQGASMNGVKPSPSLTTESQAKNQPTSKVPAQTGMKSSAPAVPPAKEAATEVPQQANIQPPVQPPQDMQQMPKPQMQELNDTTVESLEKRSRIIRLVILVASILIIVGLVFAGIYIYNSWLKNATIDTTTDTTTEGTEQTGGQPAEESTDRDGDTLPNDWEEKYGLNPDDSSDALKDNDFDGLNNLEEYKYQTNPKDSDSDKDGYSDGQEVEGGFNPAGTGRLEGESNNQASNTAFLAGSWTGSMNGKSYDFSDIEITIRSDGKISEIYTIDYNEEKVENDGMGDFEIEREINSFKSEVNMQGVADSGSGTYLIGFNGTIASDNNEISGTWFIIPSSLTAPWMIQDKGTFTFKRS